LDCEKQKWTNDQKYLRHHTQTTHTGAGPGGGGPWQDQERLYLLADKTGH